MSKEYVDRSRDEEIIDIINSILSHGIWKVETINEAVLAKLMELRNTPIKYHSTNRDIDADYEGWKEDSFNRQ